MNFWTICCESILTAFLWILCNQSHFYKWWLLLHQAVTLWDCLDLCSTSISASSNSCFVLLSFKTLDYDVITVCNHISFLKPKNDLIFQISSYHSLRDPYLAQNARPGLLLPSFGASFVLQRWHIYLIVHGFPLNGKCQAEREYTYHVHHNASEGSIQLGIYLPTSICIMDYFVNGAICENWTNNLMDID